jgi:hypothetical protein
MLHKSSFAGIPLINLPPALIIRHVSLNPAPTAKERRSTATDAQINDNMAVFVMLKIN